LCGIFLLFVSIFVFLVHIASKLPGHEDVVRVLIGENTSMTSLENSNGQIPLLCSIQAGSTLTGK
jgi:hypothetical protein